MELRQYVSIIQKWLWLIILGAILGAGSAFVFSIFSTPIYQSTLTLLVSEGSSSPGDTYSTILTSQRLATTYVEQLKSPVITGQVVRDLNLPMRPEQLGAMMTIQSVRDTQLIRISVEDDSPQRAQAIATQIAKAFINYIASVQQARYQVAQKDLEQQVAEARKKIDDIQKALAPLGDPSDPKSLSAPEFVRTERLRLQMELTTQQAQYTVLLKGVQDFRFAASRSVDSITVSSPAEVPEVPVRPRTSLNTLLGLVVGVLLGVGTAFLIEYLDDTLKSPDDVKRVLDLTTLGAVVRFPNVKSARDTLVTVESPLAPYAEAFRNLRTNLQFSLAQNSSSALVVSSAEPGEGKSTMTANLAAAFAQMGKQVILVDTDLRRPTLHQFFNLSPEPGLTDLLLNRNASLDQLIRETDVAGVRLLTSGKLPPNPAEILASEWMGELIESLKQRADIVLFDSPPILPVTDAALLASKTGYLLWVVGVGSTRTDAARRAQATLAHVNAKIIGVVLNRLVAGKGYGYYYYYYYSKDGHRKEHKKQRGESATTRLSAPMTPGNGRSNGGDQQKTKMPTQGPEM